MNNKWLVSIAVISLLLNIGVISLGGVNAQVSLISIPPLTKDTGYVLKVPNNNYTCVSLEQSLGLQRGDIESISTEEGKGMTIKFKKGVLLDSAKVQLATEVVKGLIPTIEVK